MTKKKKWWMYGLCGILCFFVFAVIIRHIKKENIPAENTIWYFYEEECGGCDKEGEFYHLLKDRMAGISLPEDVSIRCVNLFTDDETMWTQVCDRLDLLEEERQLPMVIAGDQYVFGEEEIYHHLRHLTCQLYNIKDQGTIWYYYRPDCKDCERIETLIQNQFASYPMLSFIQVDTTDVKNKTLFKEKLKKRQIAEEEWQVPFLDDWEAYLSGDQAIEEHIEQFLQERAAAIHSEP